jgi:hypothetical protein
MNQLLLAVVTVIATLAPVAARGWSWASAGGTVLVGVVGFVLNIRADRRASREEARAIRAEQRAQAAEDRAVREEQRAEAAEIRALGAERREREAHEWDRETREREQKDVRERSRVEAWVVAKKQAHGTAFFPVDVDAELDVARAARRLGLLTLKELGGNDGSVVAAHAQAK